MLNIIMVLLLIGVFWFLWFRSNNQERWKKVIFSVLALFVFTVSMASNSIEAQNSTTLDNEIAKNEELTETISTLEADHLDLQEKLDNFEETITQLNKEIETLTKKNEELQTDNDSAQEKVGKLEEKVTQLEKENDGLQKKLDESEKEPSTASNSKKETATSNEKNTDTSSNKSTETQSKDTGGTNTSEKSSNEKAEKSSTAAATDTASDSQSTGDCDIKGSVNGIYHVPGSTYYSRTKNVVQWFCSTQEAEDAGYRAPKK